MLWFNDLFMFIHVFVSPCVGGSIALYIVYGTASGHFIRSAMPQGRIAHAPWHWLSAHQLSFLVRRMLNCQIIQVPRGKRMTKPDKQELQYVY